MKLILAGKKVIVSGFNQAVSFITVLASSAFRWGADLIGGIVNGIRSCIGNVINVVSDVEADSGGETETGTSLVKDTSYKGLWKVSFTLQEF